MGTPRRPSEFLGHTAPDQVTPYPQSAPNTRSEFVGHDLGEMETDPLRVSIDQAAQTTPDRAVRIEQLRRETGLAPGVIERNFDFYDKTSKGGQWDVENLKKTSPGVAAFLAQPENAAMASPDINRLRRVEHDLSAAAPLLRGIDNLQGTAYGFAEWLGDLTGQQALTRYGREGRERNVLEAQAYGEGASLTKAFDSPADFGNYVYQLVGEQIPMMAPAMAGGYGGAAAGAAIGSAFFGVGAAPGAVVGGIIGAFVPSFVLGIGETQGSLKQIDPSASAPGAVFLGGTAIAALDTALPGKLGGRLVKTFGAETAEQVARRLLLQPVKPRFWVRSAQGAIVGASTEAITEAFQEAIGGVTAAYGTDTRVNWGELAFQSLEAGAAGFILGGTFEGLQTAAEHRQEQAKFLAAEQQKAYFDALGKNLTDVELKDKLPDKMREFVAQVTKDGPVEQVFVPLQQFEEYWQSKGASANEVAAALTGQRDALDLAKQSNTGLLAIKTADYATHLAATEHHEFFKNELKLRPDIANVREVQEVIAAAERTRQEQGERLVKAQEAQTADLAARVTARYIADGMPPRQAKAHAQMWAGRYVVGATRFGEDPIARFEREPPHVIYSLPSGAPLRPMAGEAAPAPAAAPAAAAPALPDTVFEPERETALAAAFQALPVEPSARVALTEQGFSLADVQALEGEGLASGGTMSREQFSDWLDAKGRRDQQAAAPAVVLANLPPSVAPPGETGAQRERRRTFHLTALNAGLVRDALALDPTVDPAVVRAELNRRIAYDEERQATMRESGQGQALLRAIAAYGGLWWEEQTGGFKGEVEHYAREGRDPRERRDRGRPTTWNGVAGVFREDGLTPDAMVEALGQEGDFSAIATPNDLFDAIDVALRATPDTDTLPGTDDLARLGVIPGTPWWEDSWGVDPATQPIEVADYDDDGEVDEGITFDAAEFEQRLRLGKLPHRATVAVAPGAVIEGEGPFSTSGSVRIHLPGGAHITVFKPEAYAEDAPRDYLAVGFSYVPESQRRQGVGRKLYEAAVGFAIQQGYRGLSSDPRERNELSDAMWKALERDGRVSSVGRQEVVTYTGGDFFQRTTPATPEARIAALPDITLDNVPDVAKRFPFPVVSDLEATALYAALVEGPGEVTTVPVKDIVGTQLWVFPGPATAVLDVPGAGDPPIAMFHAGKYYLADGHHRALAAWAKQEPLFQVTLRRVDPVRLAEERLRHVEAPPSGTMGAVVRGAEKTAGTREAEEQLRILRQARLNAPLPSEEAARTSPRKEAAMGSEDEDTGEFFQPLKPETTPAGFEAVAEHLAPAETANFNRQSARQLVDAFAALPADLDVEQTALAGEAHKGWYERSQRAIFGVFGPVDGIRFTALLAAMSPQTSVEQNILNTVRLWANWDAAGRPRGPKAIKALLAQSVAGTGTEASVLPAWLPNATRALRAAEGERITLSGPKVASFAFNLWGFLHEGTLDTWMETFAGPEFKLTRRGKTRETSLDPGKTPSYKAYVAKLRRVAQTLTKKTGEPWTAANVQETVWAWSYALMNLAKAVNYPATEMAKHRGMLLTAISDVPDFEKLLARDPELRSILTEAGYGDALTTVARAFTRRSQRDTAAQKQRLEAAIRSSGQSLAVGLQRSAARIEAVRQARLRAAEAKRAPAQTQAVVEQKARTAREAARTRRTARAATDTGEFYQTIATQPASSTTASFYSRLALPVRAAKVEKAKGVDWKAIIRNAKTGINLDEYAAVGVDALEDGTTYTRDQVLAFLAEHEVHVESVEWADPGQLLDPKLLDREANDLYEQRVVEATDDLEEQGRAPREFSEEDLEVLPDGDAFVVLVEGENIDAWAYHDSEDDALIAGKAWLAEENARRRRAFESEVRDSVSWPDAERDAESSLREKLRDRHAHFTQYVVPGAIAGSYREVHLTAPKAVRVGAKSVVEEQRLRIQEAIARVAGEEFATADPEDRATARDALQKLLDGGDYEVVRGDKFRTLTDAENVYVRYFAARLADDLKAMPRTIADANKWSDGHSEFATVPNPIVRLRYNVRRLAVAGVERLVLFLEEVQPPVKRADTGVNEFDKVPEVFRNNWRALAMRWALQHAAVNGYEGVAWTSGEMQLERWPVRAHARTQVYHPQEGIFVAYDEDGTVLMKRTGVAADDLRRLVGDVDAQKLLAAPAERNAQGNVRLILTEGTAELGGEGLEALYDKGLGNDANKLPVMRRHKVTTKTLEIANAAERTTYTGPTYTASDLMGMLEAQKTAAVPSGQRWSKLTRSFAYTVAQDMEDHGSTFPDAMARFGSDALAKVLGGAITVETVSKTVPAIVMPQAMRAALLTGGQEFFSRVGKRPGKRTRADKTAPYQHTLFGDPIKPVPPFQAQLPTRTELVTQRQRRLGRDYVRTAAEAASAMAYLAQGAQERFDALVVDTEGRPLAIVGNFKGTVSATMVHPDIVLAEALQVPGAARLWFAHNHPSGDPKLSPADLAMVKTMGEVFAESGIQVAGILAIGAGMQGRSWQFAKPSGAGQEAGQVQVDPLAQTTVPVQEREFVATTKLDETPLLSPAIVESILPSIAKRRFGVVFVDAQLRVTGFAPLDPATAMTLKEEGRAADLYRTVSQSGASRAFVYASKHSEQAAALNVAQALHGIGVEVMDLVEPRGSARLDNKRLTGDFTQPLEGEGPPGAEQPYEGVKGAFNRFTGWIRLIEGAHDLSTFLHESGHAFLHDLLSDALELSTRDPATLTELQQGVVRDAHTVLRWFSFEGTIADFLALTTDQQRDMHERWANAFEVYLMTGKAPSVDLRPVFALFRSWLLAAYKLLGRAGLVDQALAEQVKGVQLPQEVREVMDRLLATDEAIAAARAESEVVPLFTDAASAGVDALTFAAYRRQVEEASLAAREQVDARLLADWRREQQAQWQREREQVRAQVLAEATQNPVFVALSVMRTGKLPDGTIPSFGDGAPMKLSRAAIVQMKGERFLKTLPRPYLYSAQGGLHPDIVAEMIGFSSGDAMLDALVGAKPHQPVIESETDRRMRAEHGDAMLDGLELKDLASQALHEHRGEVISAELKALTQGMANVAIPSNAALRSAAETAIAGLPVREVRPGLYLQAATQASRRAFNAFAKNDRGAAIKAKQDELTNLALYRAALAAKDRAQKSARLLGEYQNSRGRRANLLRAGVDYLDQVDALLERYEFTKTSQKAQQRRLSLRRFIEQQQQAGVPLQIPNWLIDDSRVINYQSLTVEELEGLRAAVEHLAHMARVKKRLLDAREEKELEAVQIEIEDSIRAHHDRRPVSYEPRVGFERTRSFSAGLLYSHRKIASIARQLDGFEDGGPMWHYVIRRMNDAANRESTMSTSAMLKLRGIFEQHYSAGERANFTKQRSTPTLRIPGVDRPSFTKMALLMMALNQGNDQNRQRLRDGYHWTQEQVQQALDANLDKRDWDFVQAMWDEIDSYWPQIVEKQSRVIGAAPEKVLPTPVFTRFGEYRGGYFPIVWERALSGKSVNLEEGSAAKLAEAAAYVHATTRRGHLERRVEGDVRDQPVRLDFNVIAEHLNQVIHDLTHHEALIDVGRILDVEGPVHKAIIETLGVKAYEQFRTAVRDIAIGDVPARNEVEGLLRYLSNGMSVVGLGWNLVSAAVQMIGLTQSVARVGPAWMARGLVSYWRGALTMQSTAKAINEESALMRQRAADMSPELHDLRRQLGIYDGRFAGWMDAAMRGLTFDRYTKQSIGNGYLKLIEVMQAMVDRPTYLGAKAKAVADPRNLDANGVVDEAKCIAIAEQAVIDSQGSGRIKDLAAVQRGGPAWQAWVKFYSFFNVTYNQFAESYRRSTGSNRLLPNPKNPAKVALLAVDFLLLFTLPTVLNHLIRSGLRGSLDDELEDPDELLWTLGKEHLAYMMGMMVLVRELGGTMQGLGRYEGPAGTRGIGTVSQFLTQVSQLETDEAFWRTLNQAGGVVFHYPAVQVERTVRGIQALMDGRTENPGAVLFGPPPER